MANKLPWTTPLKTYVIREVAINEWSSGHKVRGYNRMPEKYRALLDKQR